MQARNNDVKDSDFTDEMHEESSKRNHDFLIASRVTGERYVSASIATSNEVSSFSLQVCFPILVVSSVQFLKEFKFRDERIWNVHLSKVSRMQ